MDGHIAFFNRPVQFRRKLQGILSWLHGVEESLLAKCGSDRRFFISLTFRGKQPSIPSVFSELSARWTTMKNDQVEEAQLHPLNFGCSCFVFLFCPSITEAIINVNFATTVASLLRTKKKIAWLT